MSFSPTAATKVEPASPSPGKRAKAVTAFKRHHVCSVCSRGFSTTGHLARHARVHTGERNHKCPFPGCETKCSRQDNLQQHYRIHLSPGSRRKSGRSVLRSNSTPAPSPPSASPSTSDSPPYPNRLDSPPLEPPPLEESRLYTFGPQQCVRDSPPNTPPPLVQATYPAIAMMSHRVLPQIDTFQGGSSSRSSPDGYWHRQHERCASPVSTSDTYSAASAYQSPVATHYAHSIATSPEISPVVDSAHPSSYASSLSSSPSFSSIASSEASYPYEQPRMINAPHAHSVMHSLDARSAYPPQHHSYVDRHASHSPRGVPVSRMLTTRHSIAHIAHHTDTPQQQPAYAPPPPPQDSPSPPSSSHHSPQTPYTTFREEPAYATPAYAPADDSYVVYDVHGHMVDHAQSYHAAEMVPAMQYHGSPPTMLASLPSLRRESYPFVHAAAQRYEQYEPAPAPQVAADAPFAHLHHPQPQPPPAVEYLNEYSWKLDSMEGKLAPALVQ